jgi:hypothetical protein
VNDQPATITRVGNTFVVYIGPELAAVDFNRDGAVNVPDVFCFLGAWFRGEPAADWIGDAHISVEDIFAFLSDWFGGD